MSATVTPLSPPKHSVSSIPQPRKHEPNPHPYAIKTTSTALLSRSHSTAQSQLPKHTYVPPSPSPSPHARGHRPALSLDSDPVSPGRPLPTPPRPLPAPPGMTESPNVFSPTPPRRRPRRSDTLPVSLETMQSPVTPTVSQELPDLPTDVKLWTPNQVSAYLSAALRVNEGSQDSLPLPVARDVGAFVRTARITGRAFLRLNDDDLDELGVNPLWRTALLNASRTLRSNALRGRIWGQSDLQPLFERSHNPSISFPTAGDFSDIGSSPSPSRPLPSPPHTVAAPSPVRAYTVQTLARHETRALRSSRKGRVKGMIAHYERSASESESGSDYGVSDFSDAESPSPTTLERRSSLLNDRLLDDRLLDEEVFLQPSPAESPTSDKWPDIPMPIKSSSSEPLLASPTTSVVSTAVDSEFTHVEQPETKSPVLPIAEPNVPEEPSMESLLAEQPMMEEVAGWGARAWEDLDDAPRETVKHVSAIVPPSSTAAATPSTSGSRFPNSTMSRASARAMGRDSIRESKSERRFVSAIFAPENSKATPQAPTKPLGAVDTPAQDPASQALTEELGADEHLAVHGTQHNLLDTPGLGLGFPQFGPPAALAHRPLPAPEPVAIQSQNAAHAEPQAGHDADRLETLELELAASQTLLEGMHARLARVEARMADVEARNALRNEKAARRDAELTELRVSMGAHQVALADARAHADAAEARARAAQGEASAAGARARDAEERRIVSEKRAEDLAHHRGTVERAAKRPNAVPTPSPPTVPGGSGFGLPGFGELPGYVFLVGLGVCVITVQVVLNQVGGRVRLR